MKAVRKTAVLAVVLAMVVITAGPAAAGVGVGTSLSPPPAPTVGQTGLAASFTVVNTNTPPNNTESNVITQLKLAPSCGTSGTVANPCSVADTGVFSVSSTGSGTAGTACAGIIFSVSAPDASGIVTFTPTSTVSLAPPGGAVGTDRCTVAFTFNVLRSPSVDASPGTPGTQTSVNLVATVQGVISGLVVSAAPSVQVTVTRAAPTLSTQASQNAQAHTIADTATVTGVAGVATPTGTVTFSAYGPNDATCAGVALGSSTNALSGGAATSTSFPVSQPGTYRFVATYSGDANYNTVSGACNALNESIVVTSPPAIADFDGNRTTDVSVFRPSSGTWFVNGGLTLNYGTTGDTAVPADYDGDAKADVAVFRPSVGTWYIRNSSNGTDRLFTYGVSSDIPVPGDYDGDAKADVAVFRPSVGTWYIRNSSNGTDTIVTFGIGGDIPVTGDYDGDTKADLAVFRPSAGTWFVHRSTGGDTAQNYGASGDIPVPGDYDGDFKTDLAVFRPSVGTWYVRRSATGTDFLQTYGVSTDQVQPGDYDGDGRTDLAVFRPSTATWFARNSSNGTDTIVTFGIGGDIPLPLPNAIRRSFY